MTGIYIGNEFVDEKNSKIKITNDDLNGVYTIQFVDSGAEFENIFEEEIQFEKDEICDCESGCIFCL